MAGEKEIEVVFPLAGVNVACEFGRQPKLTTPLGVNVRANEALTNRSRGGSRSGLTKFLADTVPSGPGLIQHLALVVDPQEPALFTDGVVELPGYILDPSTNNNAGGRGDRNPGRWVRPGGSGKQQNKHPIGSGDIQAVGTVTNITPQDGYFTGDISYTSGGFGVGGYSIEVYVGTGPGGSPPEGTQVWIVDSGTADSMANTPQPYQFTGDFTPSQPRTYSVTGTIS